MSGNLVHLDRRFGGHGGIPTEWEISTELEDLKELIRSLPTIPGVQITQIEQRFYHNHWIVLPQGTPYHLAGAVAAALAASDRCALIHELHKVNALVTTNDLPKQE